MPIEINESDSGRGTIITLSGFVESGEFAFHITKHLFNDESVFKVYQYSLVDCSAVTGTDISASEVSRIRSRMDEVAIKAKSRGVIAFYAEEALVYKVGKLMESRVHEDGWELRTFKERSEAEGWIRSKVEENFGTTDLTLQPD